MRERVRGPGDTQPHGDAERSGRETNVARTTLFAEVTLDGAAPVRGDETKCHAEQTLLHDSGPSSVSTS